MPPAAYYQMGSIALTAGAAVVLGTSGSADTTIRVDGMALLAGIDTFTLGMILLILGLLANITSFYLRWRQWPKADQK